MQTVSNFSINVMHATFEAETMNYFQNLTQIFFPQNRQLRLL